jgi:hypothetical protein
MAVSPRLCDYLSIGLWWMYYVDILIVCDVRQRWLLPLTSSCWLMSLGISVYTPDVIAMSGYRYCSKDLFLFCFVYYKGEAVQKRQVVI